MEYVVYVDSNNRNQRLYPNANSYTLHLTTPIKNISNVEVVSAMLPNVFSSQYLTLDIAELRTPTSLVADALANTVPTSNAFYGTFAHFAHQGESNARIERHDPWKHLLDIQL
jgi:hypothetical protein